MSLKQKLKTIIETNGMISRDDLRERMREKYDIATTDRKLRELTEDKIITPIYRDKFISAYMWNEKKEVVVEKKSEQGSIFEKMFGKLKIID